MPVIVNTLTGTTNTYQTPASAVQFDLRETVIDGIISGFSINAQASPNMTVIVRQGELVVTATPTSETVRKHRVRLTADANVTIASNSSGSTKYDIVYLLLPAATLQAPPASGDFTEAATLLTLRKNTSGENLGVANAIPLAEVAVSNGAVSITNANITHIFDDALSGWLDFPNTVTCTVAGTAWTATTSGDWSRRLSACDYFYWKELSGSTLQSEFGCVLTTTYSSATNLTTITGFSGTGSSMTAGALLLPRYSKVANPTGGTRGIIAKPVQITSDFTTAATTATQVTGMTITVNVTAAIAARGIKIVAFASNIRNQTGTKESFMTIWDGTVGSGTQLTRGNFVSASADYGVPFNIEAVVYPSVGSHTYNVGLHSTAAGTAALSAAATYPATLTVEAL